jgi:hypothetical protein
MEDQVEISYIHTLHTNVYVSYPFHLNQSAFIPCLTLFFPAFNDDVNICMMDSLIQKKFFSKEKLMDLN